MSRDDYVKALSFINYHMDGTMDRVNTMYSSINQENNKQDVYCESPSPKSPKKDLRNFEKSPTTVRRTDAQARYRSGVPAIKESVPRKNKFPVNKSENMREGKNSDPKTTGNYSVKNGAFNLKVNRVCFV